MPRKIAFTSLIVTRGRRRGCPCGPAAALAALALIGALAGRQAERRQVVLERDRPADRIDGGHALLERRPRNAVVQQPSHVRRALAVPREHDRHIGAHLAEEFVDLETGIFPRADGRAAHVAPAGHTTGR